MRPWIMVSVALLVVTGLGAFGDQPKVEKANRAKQKGVTKQGQADNEKRRIFRVECDIEVEQRDANGDIISEGKLLPGRSLWRTHTVFDIPDGETYLQPFSADSFGMKVTSWEDGAIHLEVFWKQTRGELHEVGASSSWTVSLKATKNVKLGDKVILQSGDEKTMGTKMTFAGVIEEKDHEKK